MQHFISTLRDIPNIPSDIVGETQSTIPEAELGLFARRDIKKGEFICAYNGKKYRRVPKEARYCIRLLPNGMYLLDAIDIKSCHGRFSNDPCHHLLDNSVIVGDFDNSVILEATRDIRAGEEIFCSYGWEYYTNEDLNINFRRKGILRYWSNNIVSASSNPSHRSEIKKLAKLIGRC